MMDTNKYFRPEIVRMAPYKPGEQPGAAKVIKLNTNESPYPPSPRVREAIAAASERLERYPDPLGTSFRRVAADVLGVSADQILCGNGSDDILTILTRAFVGHGERLRLPFPSYIRTLTSNPNRILSSSSYPIPTAPVGHRSLPRPFWSWLKGLIARLWWTKPTSTSHRNIVSDWSPRIPASW